MYTIRAVLWTHKKNSKGLCPLKIAVTIKRKVTYFATPFKLLESQWTHEIVNYPNEKQANAVLRKLINEKEKEILNWTLTKEVTSQSLKNPSSIKLSTFAKEIKGERVHNNKEINRVKAFAGDINLDQITVTFLRRYEQYERDRGMAQNTVNTTFRWLRNMINRAISEKLIRENPFLEYKVPKYIQTDRTYLEKSERELILSKVNTLQEPLFTTCVYFLVGCYSGLRFSDWKNLSYTKDFVKLRAKKNGELVVVPIGPSLRKILALTKKAGQLSSEQKTNVYLKAIAAAIGIKKHLTTHVARHSFATMCADQGLSKEVTAELLGISTKVVEVYYRMTGANIKIQAAALKKV